MYTPTPAPRLALVFDVAEPSGVYLPTVAPLRSGPFVTASEAVVGQWGMIPPSSATRTPKTAKGQRMSTNNCRRESMAKSWTFGQAWRAGQRCLIPAENFDEPNWESGKNEWWRFSRADGQPWALAGLWSTWVDPETGEVVPSYTMITQNCDAHPLLRRMHKPDPKLAADQQDKRAVVPLERDQWDQWLNGSNEQADKLIQLPAEHLFAAGPAARPAPVPPPLPETGSLF
ncbi:MAG: SOS response-associated peptidase family protein [Polaromonas sp.]|nr:SOS response-associated peptidase family protein [Polaromonas sp.]